MNAETCFTFQQPGAKDDPCQVTWYKTGAYEASLCTKTVRNSNFQPFFHLNNANIIKEHHNFLDN